MSGFDHGQTPKTRQMPPNKTALVAALDIGSREGYSAVLTAQGLAGGDKSGVTTAKNTGTMVTMLTGVASTLKDIRSGLSGDGGGMLIDKLEAV